MFDFLKSRTPVEKLTKRLTETAGDDGPRIEAAEKLAEMDTPEATFALVKRFTVSSKVITQDIEEKRMVVQMLADKGPRAVEPELYGGPHVAGDEAGPEGELHVEQYIELPVGELQVLVR